MHFKKLVIPLVLVLTMIITSGCGGIRGMVFKEEAKPASTVPHKANDLKTDTYYLKNGTNFYKTYNVDSNIDHAEDAADQTRILWTSKDQDDLIPVLYRGEPIVKVADSDDPIDQEVQIERFKDIGYTIGAAGFYPDDKGIQAVKGKEALKPKSDAYKKFMAKFGENTTADDPIAVESVSKKELSQDNISSALTITGLKKNKVYDIGFYIGTKFHEDKIKADTHIYQSSETILITSIDMTKNGYAAINMPENLKTGYYYIEDAGMFKYVDADRHDDISKLDYNEPNDEVQSRAVEETTKDAVREEKYTIDKDYKKAEFSLRFDDSQTTVNTAYVRLPSGDKKEFEAGSFELEKPAKGVYTVYIKGKNIDLVEINFETGEEIVEEEEEKKEEEKKGTADEEQEAPKATTNSNSSQKSSGSSGSNRSSGSSSSGSSSSGSSGTSSGSQTIYQEVPINEPLNNPEISGTIGD